MSVTQIAPNEFINWVKSQTNPIILLDVRDSSELTKAKIPTKFLQQLGVTFMHIPMADIPYRLNELDIDSSIACLCHAGVRSNSVAHFLQKNDYDYLANIIGGIDAWAIQLDNSIARY